VPPGPGTPAALTSSEFSRFDDFSRRRFHPCADLPHNAGNERRTGMDGEARHERTIRRIFALLVAFAGLAERAAGRSYPVRFLLLLVLRHAEVIARDYVADRMLVDGLWFDDGMECTSSPEDAALLAERFRLLAAELCALLPPTGWRGHATHGATHGAVAPGGVVGRAAPRAGIEPTGFGGRRPVAYDTS
jgi:hypothetical protein